MSIQGLDAQNLVTFKNSQGTEARGTLLKLTRSTIVFEIYNPYSIVQLSEVLQDLTLYHRNRIIYDGRGVVTNMMNTGLMLVVSVTLIDSWANLAARMSQPHELAMDVSHFIGDWEKSFRIHSGYQLAVSRLRAFLGEFRNWLEQLEIEPFSDGERGPFHQNIDTDSFDAISNPSLPQLEQLFSNFEREAKEVEEDNLAIHKAYAQRDLHPLMLHSPFIHRAYTKPLGYAGDYEMVNMMLRDDREGPSIFSQILNRYYLNIGPSIAHRNRIEILLSKLVEISLDAEKNNRKARILNIGCGPAIEIQRFVREYALSSRCEFRLVDFNDTTIEHAKRMIEKSAIESGNQPKVSYTQQSVHTLIKQASSSANTKEIDRYDFVYCAGLFDYLSDKVCQRLLSLFYRWIRIGGKIVATNVHPSNPNRYQMEHLAEWYLVYRTSQQMKNISPTKGSSDIFLDKSGVNVFLEVVKTISE